jgi:hypothetical protein
LEIWSSQFRQRAGTGDAISKFRFKKALEFVGQNFERFRTKKYRFGQTIFGQFRKIHFAVSLREPAIS